MTKPRLKKIPQSGLSRFRQYAEIGDAVEVWPLIRRHGQPSSFYVQIINVIRNKYGRISYEIPRYQGFEKRYLVLTEELTPLAHAGVPL